MGSTNAVGETSPAGIFVGLGNVDPVKELVTLIKTQRPSS